MSNSLCGQLCDSDSIIRLDTTFNSNHVTMHTMAESQLSGNIITSLYNKLGNCLLDQVFWAAERSTTKWILSTRIPRHLQCCRNNGCMAVRVQWPEPPHAQPASFGAVTLQCVG